MFRRDERQNIHRSQLFWCELQKILWVNPVDLCHKGTPTATPKGFWLRARCLRGDSGWAKMSAAWQEFGDCTTHKNADFGDGVRHWVYHGLPHYNFDSNSSKDHDLNMPCGKLNDTPPLGRLWSRNEPFFLSFLEDFGIFQRPVRCAQSEVWCAGFDGGFHGRPRAVSPLRGWGSIETIEGIWVDPLTSRKRGPDFKMLAGSRQG